MDGAGKASLHYRVHQPPGGRALQREKDLGSKSWRKPYWGDNCSLRENKQTHHLSLRPEMQRTYLRPCFRLFSSHILFLGSSPRMGTVSRRQI